MVLHILRATFILLAAAVGWFFVQHPSRPFGAYTWLAMATSLSIGVFLILVDILSPRKKLLVFSGTILGILVGLSIAWALSFVVRLLVDQYMPAPNLEGVRDAQKALAQFASRRDAITMFANLLIGVSCCYLAISFILQTRDDFRFIIPYVEFSKQTKGARPMLVDTSVIIDGRIVDVANTGILESRLVVPRFVLQELQTVADSADKLKRNRGRRGLDVLNKLQGNRRVEVIIYEGTIRDEADLGGVDQKLLTTAKELHARVLTNDFNLSKVAQLQGVDIINLNDLAGALRPVVLPGEKLQVRLVKHGEDPSQGIGYLDDGTMVVVEQGRSHIGDTVELVVNNVLQTSAGRMIFGRMENAVARAKGKGRADDTAEADARKPIENSAGKPGAT